jgi:hypothetical protein
MEPNLTDSWEEEIQNYTNEVDLQWGGVIELFVTQFLQIRSKTKINNQHTFCTIIFSHH